MLKKEVQEILEVRKKEMIECRKRPIRFLDDIYTLSSTELEERVDEDIVVISYKGVKDYWRIEEVETIPVELILINPLKNRYSVKYEVIDEKDLEVPEGYDLPEMCQEDPARIWHGWDAGTVVRITRKDGTTYERKVKSWNF